MTDKVWSAEELKEVNGRLEGATPQEILKWVADNFDTKEFALASSFAECVLVDMLVKIKKDARIFYLDTGHLFKETLDVVEKVRKKYGINIERYASDIPIEEMDRVHGPELWKRDPDLCCDLRKIVALKKALSGLKLWITGIRREQAKTRADIPVIGMDAKYGLIKVSPLAAWTKKQVWDYVCANEVPYNILLDQGYTSIGCEPCTRPVKPGEDPRSGRWAGFEKKECGLHK